MAKPLSWKWKLLIAFIVLFLISFAFVLTPWGHNAMYNHMLGNFEAAAPAERREMNTANNFLYLAWWRGTICMDDKAAMQMYREFCGLPKEVIDNSVFENNPKGKLKSPFVSEDGKTGWGPLHPRAPEAYYHYLIYHEIHFSSGRSIDQYYNYYRLFYDWSRAHSPDKKPHPKFNKYWGKIRELIAKIPGHTPPLDINPQAPAAVPYIPEPGEESDVAPIISTPH
jgi:hypothetical protein